MTDAMTALLSSVRRERGGNGDLPAPRSARVVLESCRGWFVFRTEPVTLLLVGTTVKPTNGVRRGRSCRPRHLRCAAPNAAHGVGEHAAGPRHLRDATGDRRAHGRRAGRGNRR